jgi:hypothetical protein
MTEIDARIHYRVDPDYIRHLMDKAGLSQREFARLIGVNDATVRRWVMYPPRAEMPYTAQVCLEILVDRMAERMRAERETAAVDQESAPDHQAG